jgi:hypothetical protein
MALKGSVGSMMGQVCRAVCVLCVLCCWHQELITHWLPPPLAIAHTLHTLPVCLPTTPHRSAA